jgi:predicted permease
MVAPLIMLSVGLSLRPQSIARSAVPLAVLTAIKLVAAPLVALGVGSAVLAEAPLRVAVLQAGMPSMMLTFVVGERFGLDTDFIAAAIFVTTVAAAVSIPIMQAVAF